MELPEDGFFMSEALRHAAKAAMAGEVPVGAVIVQNGAIIGTGRNRREEHKNALSHAEIEAIDQACKKLGGWRLSNCTLYVTLEPCPMCAGAIINARIDRVVYGAADPKAGSVHSITCVRSLRSCVRKTYNKRKERSYAKSVRSAGRFTARRQI